MTAEKQDINDILSKCNNCKLDECVGCEITYTEIQNIRDYIKNYHKWNKAIAKDLEESIPKQKIQDKIDELNCEIDKYQEHRIKQEETDVDYYTNIGNEIAKDILQELLEDKESVGG